MYPASPVKRVLIVEDDAVLRELMIDHLQDDTYSIHAASTMTEAGELLRHATIDLVLLDLNLPDGDGLELCSQLRAAGHEGGIMIVSARRTATDRALGFELGADDYLTKPFEPLELIARMRNLLRRSGGIRTGPGRARIAHLGPWRLDLEQRRLIAPDDRLIMLSSAEFRLLNRLMASPDRALSREELLPERGATVAFDRSIDLQISRLRQKLAAVKGGDALIITVRGEGYLMPIPVTYE